MRVIRLVTISHLCLLVIVVVIVFFVICNKIMWTLEGVSMFSSRVLKIVSVRY